MTFDNRRRDKYGNSDASGGASAISPGKRTLTSALSVQRKASTSAASTPANPATTAPAIEPANSTVEGTAPPSSTDVHAAAERGTSGSGGALPHAERIQAAFGGHDVSNVQAYTGGTASEASTARGAEAYATGNKVAFRGAPSLHTAAHEAAHVIQQRAGVSLSGGVGQLGDTYEQHADAVADAVVQGRSAEGLLDRHAGGGSSGVQRLSLQQHPRRESGTTPAPTATPTTQPAPAPAPAASGVAPVCDTSSAARQAEARANNPPDAASNRNFAQAQESAHIRNFFSSLEQLRPGGRGDQVVIIVGSGGEQIYNRAVAEQLRTAVRGELNARIDRLTAMLAGAHAAMETLRSNGNDVTNPIDFPRLERAYQYALGDVAGLRAAVAENLFSYVNTHLAAAASACRSVERQVAGVRDDTIVAECTAYGLEFVRGVSLAVFAVLAVAATGGLAGAGLTAGATMAVEGAQQRSEVATDQRSEVNGTEIAMRGALAGLATLFGAVGSELVRSVGGRLLVGEVEALLVQSGAVTATEAHALAPRATKKVIKWALDQLRSGMGLGSDAIRERTGVSARTSSTTIPAQVNDRVRAILPEDVGGDDPINQAIHYVHTVDYESFVRSQALGWARDAATGAAEVSSRTPASANTIDVVNERISSVRR